MDERQYLTVDLAKVGTDHIVLVRNGTDADRQHVLDWMRSMRSDGSAVPQVFAVHPSDAAFDPGKPAPTVRVNRDHPAVRREPPRLEMQPAGELAEATG